MVKYCCAERGRAGRDEPQHRILYMYWFVTSQDMGAADRPSSAPAPPDMAGGQPVHEYCTAFLNLGGRPGGADYAGPVAQCRWDDGCAQVQQGQKLVVVFADAAADDEQVWPQQFFQSVVVDV